LRVSGIFTCKFMGKFFFVFFVEKQPLLFTFLSSALLSTFLRKQLLLSTCFEKNSFTFYFFAKTASLSTFLRKQLLLSHFCYFPLCGELALLSMFSCFSIFAEVVSRFPNFFVRNTKQKHRITFSCDKQGSFGAISLSV